MDVGRTMPFAAEAEQAVLASMIISENALSRALERLKADDFYLEQHKIIFESLIALFNAGKPADVITVGEELKDKLEIVGGVSYLAHLANSVDTTAHLTHYMDIVEGKSMLRKLIGAAGKISRMSYEGSEEVEIIIDRSEQLIFEILQSRGLSDFMHVRDVITESLAEIEALSRVGGRLSGVPTGFAEVDDKTGGLQKSDLVLIAGRPAMGKTSLGLNIAQNAAIRAKVPVAVFSLEMSREQLANRILCSEALVESSKMRTGSLSGDEFKRIASALSSILSAPIYIDDSPSITVTAMKAKCRRLKLEKNVGLVIVDYLQLMQGKGRTENRQQEISEISRSLKIMAKELNLPVVTLSQLSRGPESRSDKRPLLSDLRESGAIEQDADIVMLLYREDYYDKETDKKNIAECIIAKHRNGSTGTVELVWREEYTTFMNYDRAHN